MPTKLFICSAMSVCFAASAMGATYRFGGDTGPGPDDDWMNYQNWQNQTSGVNGWDSVIPLPGASDTVRFNYGGASGVLADDAGTIGALELAVGEGGSLTINLGGVLLVNGTSGWSGMGAGGSSSGSLTIDGGLLTIQDHAWQMGVNDNAYTVDLTVESGEMRVVNAFIQSKATTTSTTTVNGGLLDVNAMTLSAGVVDIGGGMLRIRAGTTETDITSWVSSGLMTFDGATGGIEGVDYNLDTWGPNGWEITAIPEPSSAALLGLLGLGMVMKRRRL